MIKINVNDVHVVAEVDVRTSLLAFLREHLALLGSKFGCGEGECGACTVLVDGVARLSCLTTVGNVANQLVTTIEGLTGDLVGEDVMSRMAECDALQCGFCTPGIVVSLTALGREEVDTISPDDARSALVGNLCRCTGYRPIVEAATRVQPRPCSVPSSMKLPIVGSHYARPATVDDALAIRRLDGWRPVAGGTDLYVQHPPMQIERLLDLSAIDALRTITETDDLVRIGATATYTEIAQSPIIERWCQPLPAAVRLIGGRQIQNQGTIGGNIANASPAGDALPVLCVLNAQVELASTVGVRRVPVAEFLVAPGQTRLQQDELITAVLIDKAKFLNETVSFFVKVGPRRAQAISIVNAAFRARRIRDRLMDVRVSFGAVGPTVSIDSAVSRALETGALSVELVQWAATQSSAQPISDIRASAEYRHRLVGGALLRGFYNAGLLP